MGESVGYCRSTYNMERFGPIIALLFLLYLSSQVSASENRKKAISIFNVVKFKNDVCAGGGNQNGTCYTAEECSAIDGTASGTCAEGYGVCCIVSLACGSTSKQNCTYLVQTAVTAPTTNPCTYNICPASSNICRIRLDFMTFVIAGPSVNSETVGNGYGSCQTDTFTASSTSGAVPQICGTNTGQHIYLDTDGSTCSSVGFTFGGTAVSRQYDIKVLQYDCSNEMGGSAGCLQYFTTDMGTFASFNYITPINGVTNPHLASQDYNVCVRRNSGKCRICYETTIAAAIAATDSSSYGLSKDAAKKGAIGSNCDSDYLEIQGLTTEAISAITDWPAADPRLINLGKICGQTLDSTAIAVNVPAAVCTANVPFNVRFVSNVGELADETNAAMGPTMATVGFSLNYRQVDC